MPKMIDQNTLETTVCLEIPDAGPHDPDFEDITVHVVSTGGEYRAPDHGSWGSDWDFSGTDEVELAVHLPGEDEPCYDLMNRLTPEQWDTLEAEYREASSPRPTFARPRIAM